jgi:integrase
VARVDRKPYVLYKRSTSKNKAVYYARFRDRNGRIVARSTGQTSRAAADRWAIDYLSRGQIVEKENIKFRDYAEGFFTDTSDYVLYLRERGKNIGATQLAHMDAHVRRHLLPYFGDKRLSEIDIEDVENWQSWLLREGGLAPATINKSLITLRHIFRQAYRKHFVQRNPCTGVTALASKAKERGVFTLEEIRSLFADLAIWEDSRHYLIAKLAAATGMRLGEILGLQRRRVHEGWIEVAASWSQREGLKEPKTRRSKRIVRVPSVVMAELIDWMSRTPYPEPEGFVFFSADPGKPYHDSHAVDRGLYRAMERIGISEVERTTRNLVFHSLRHFFNTYLVGEGIPDGLIREVTGHASAAMTQTYTHATVSLLQPVALVQDKIFRGLGTTGQVAQPE